MRVSLGGPRLRICMFTRTRMKRRSFRACQSVYDTCVCTLASHKQLSTLNKSEAEIFHDINPKSSRLATRQTLRRENIIINPQHQTCPPIPNPNQNKAAIPRSVQSQYNTLTPSPSHHPLLTKPDEASCHTPALTQTSPRQRVPRQPYSAPRPPGPSSPPSSSRPPPAPPAAHSRGRSS